VFFYPVYILILIIPVIVFRLHSYIDNNNRNFIKYLIFHFIFQFCTVASMTLDFFFKINTPIIITCIIRTLAFAFYTLFIVSFKTNKTSIKDIFYFLPIILYVIILLMNNYGIEILPFPIRDIPELKLNGFVSTDFIGKIDYYFVLCFNALLYVSIILLNSINLLKSIDLNDKIKNGISNFMVYYFSLLTLVQILTLLCLGFLFVNIELKNLIFFTKILAIITFLILIIKPSILRKISTGNALNKIGKESKKTFNLITFKILENKGYLTPEYNLSNISSETGIKNYTLRKIIIENTNMTVPYFINSLRIDFSCKKIEDGFLEKYTILTLAKLSGFKTQENFNKVFKKFKKVTPSEYMKNPKD